MAANKSRYLPGIDGLRGIGVVIVLLFHADISWLHGAFLDIDVFFAVSGYLITTLLLREYARWGRIDLGAFLLARARRLFPALWGCVLLVAGYTIWIADPSTYRQLRLDMLSALTFTANWHFMRSGESYFAATSAPSPLLHTWSLAIEEQFYLIWPLLLLLFLRVRRGDRRGLPALLLVGAVVSAIVMAAAYVPGSDPSSIYYNTGLRAQALLVGCACAVWLEQRVVRPREPMALRLAGLPFDLPRAPAVAGAVGFGVFVALPLVGSPTESWVFRGGFLLAGLSACAVIWSITEAPDGYLNRLLSIRWLAAIGLRTYGLYVWHWPLYLILTPTRTGLHGVVLLIVRLAVTFAVAFTFDYLVERPVRARALSRLPAALRPTVVIVAAVAVVASTLAVTTHATDPVFGQALAGNVTTVTGPMLSGQKRIVVMGDSVAYTLWHYFPQASYPGVSVATSTQLGCGIAQPQALRDGDSVNPIESACLGFESRWNALEAEVSPQVAVVLSGTAELFDREINGRAVVSGTPAFHNLMVAAYAHAAEVASQGGTIPVALVNIPCYGAVQVQADTSQDVAAAASDPLNQASMKTIQNDPKRQAVLNSVLTEVAATHPYVHVVDMRSWLCPGGTYQASVDGKILRPDGVHFGKAGASDWWRRELPQLLQLGAHSPG